MDNAFASGQKLLCGGYSAYTPTGKSYFVRAGRWSTRPTIGAIIYFYSSSMGRVSHVGIVTAARLSGGVYHIHTVEGNTSGKAYDRDGGEVAEKAYSFREAEVGHGRINGFGHPVFGSDTCTAEEFLSIAKEEIGYAEKESAANLESKAGNVGQANYTKYGAWYGVNPGAWCQMFVSWCAYRACKARQAAQRTGWQQESDGWRYYVNGASVGEGWQQIGGAWYVFDSSGLMRTGWIETVDGWYYLDPASGKMVTSQWIQDHGKWYYISRSGLMAVSAYAPDSQGRGWCWLQADGTWNGNYNQTPDPVYEQVK